MKQKECVIAQTLSSSHLFELVPELASALAYNEAIARPKLIYLLNLLASHLNVNKQQYKRGKLGSSYKSLKSTHPKSTTIAITW